MSVKDVVRKSEPEVPETVIVKVPVGVEESVESVSVEEQFGLHVVGEKLAAAPDGRPETDSKTGCEVPATSVAVIVFTTELACTTVRLPPLESEKSKAGGGGGGPGGGGGGGRVLCVV